MHSLTWDHDDYIAPNWVPKRKFIGSGEDAPISKALEHREKETKSRPVPSHGDWISKGSNYRSRS